MSLYLQPIYNWGGTTSCQKKCSCLDESIQLPIQGKPKGSGITCDPIHVEDVGKPSGAFNHNPSWGLDFILPSSGVASNLCVT